MNKFEKICGFAALVFAILGAGLTFLTVGAVAMSAGPAEAPKLYLFAMPVPALALLFSIAAYSSAALRGSTQNVKPLALGSGIFAAITLILAFLGWKN